MKELIRSAREVGIKHRITVKTDSVNKVFIFSINTLGKEISFSVEQDLLILGKHTRPKFNENTGEYSGVDTFETTKKTMLETLRLGLIQLRNEIERVKNVGSKNTSS